MQRYWHRECIRSPCREVPQNQLDKLDVENKLNNNINIKTIIASLPKKRNTWEKAFPVKQSYVLAFYVKLFCRLTSNFVFSCVDMNLTSQPSFRSNIRKWFEQRATAANYSLWICDVNIRFTFALHEVWTGLYANFRSIFQLLTVFKAYS